MAATGLHTDQIARRVAATYEITSRVDWYALSWERESPSEEAKALALHTAVADFAGSLRRDVPDRTLLIRVAAQCLAWVEQLDEAAL